jgi:hypothetical protein
LTNPMPHRTDQRQELNTRFVGIQDGRTRWGSYHRLGNGPPLQCLLGVYLVGYPRTGTPPNAGRVDVTSHAANSGSDSPSIFRSGPKLTSPPSRRWPNSLLFGDNLAST